MILYNYLITFIIYKKKHYIYYLITKDIIENIIIWTLLYQEKKNIISNYTII